jgi:hypothetical protein
MSHLIDIIRVLIFNYPALPFLDDKTDFAPETLLNQVRPSYESLLFETVQDSLNYLV